MTKKVLVLPGDGIGPEIIAEAVKVLNLANKKYNLGLELVDGELGGAAIDKHGVPLADSTLALAREVDAVLLGAVGGPKWDTLAGHLRPERALLGIRKGLGLYANIRPAKLMEDLKDASPLRRETADKGFDLIIVRELTGGLYFGKSGRCQSENGETAFDTETYSVKEVRRIGKVAFDLARGRHGHVTSIDKANVIESSRLWREVIHRLAAQYPDVEVSDMLVDNAAMQLIRDPSQFDVIVTSNMFGDILSDEASQLTGSIGLLPSASLGEGRRGLYEPIHGSAPDIAGTGKANPIATILSAAMMLKMSFDLPLEAEEIESAVSAVLSKGWRTADIAAGGPSIGCEEMTGKILAEI